MGAMLMLQGQVRYHLRGRIPTHRESSCAGVMTHRAKTLYHWVQTWPASKRVLLLPVACCTRCIPHIAQHMPESSLVVGS